MAAAGAQSSPEGLCTAAGASDCASCVGVALEVARVLVQNPKLELPAPVTFLLNGGEEPILPAAHGFITQSRFIKNLGAFINLESTGPGGPDVIFQYTGALQAVCCWLRCPTMMLEGIAAIEACLL